jgi:hypothetical protein
LRLAPSKGQTWQKEEFDQFPNSEKARQGKPEFDIELIFELIETDCQTEGYAAFRFPRDDST